MQKLPWRMAVRLGKFNNWRFANVVARGVQEQGFTLWVRRPIGFKNALPQTNSGFGQCDKNHWAGQINRYLRCQRGVDVVHQARRDWPMFAQHFAQKQKAALGIGTCGKADQVIEVEKSGINAQLHQAGGQLNAHPWKGTHCSSVAVEISPTRMPERMAGMGKPSKPRSNPTKAK